MRRVLVCAFILETNGLAVECGDYVLEEFTPQLYKPTNCISPVGLDLELLKRPLRMP